MKKIYTFLFALGFMLVTTGTGFAQEMILNGDLEAWDDATHPTSWTKAENIAQATDPVHGGTYSAAHTSSADGTQDFQQDLSGTIIGGATYTISYWYLDNTPDARTRIWSYWLDGTTYLDANQEELRPGTYSEDNSEWQHYTYTLTAPAEANGFRFEVRVYGQDGNYGGAVYYDDFSVQGQGVLPEPTNYPTEFAAQVDGITINLSWTDAIGEQLPNAYLIRVAGPGIKIEPPFDGFPHPDDIDLSDNSGALNVSYGAESCSFGNLAGNTEYTFYIFPYTNAGDDIDYKTYGNMPVVHATTADINVVLSQDFNGGFGDWETVSVVGDEVWEIDNEHGVDDTPCAKMNGYSGGPQPNEDWLISPAMDLSGNAVVTLSYMTAMNYSGPEIEVLASMDYDGGGDPTTASWSPLGGTLSAGSWEWTPSGNVDMSGMISPATYLAFKYTSDDSESSTWEVDNVLAIAGAANPEPTNYPEEFTAMAAGSAIQLKWTDAIGDQLPSGYVIMGSSENSFTAPVDGTPLADDSDLSDGSGILNISFGAGSCEFSGLGVNETYYFTIFPYSNAGLNIDYKTDGTAPEASATTADIVVIEEQDFENGWGGWTYYSVSGQQEWELDNEHGINESSCAKCSGWDGTQSNENEDWLISPALDLDNFSNEVLTFFTADAYSGPALEAYISNDYTGGDPNGATWTAIEFETSSGYFEWISSGNIDLSEVSGTAVYIAFKYTSTNQESSTWEVDDILITGVGEIGIEEENGFTAAISIFPNPAADMLNVVSNSRSAITLSIFNLAGTSVLTEHSFNGHTSIDLGAIAGGVYMIRFTDLEGNQKIEKLIIK